MKPLSTNIIVCQHGARRRYAVPRIFEKTGMLKALYTDSTSESWAGKIALKINGFGPSSIQRLAKRIPQGIPSEKIYTSDVLLYQNLIRRITLCSYSEYDQWCKILASKMKRWYARDSEPTLIYNMFCENLDFIRHVKQTSNVKIISDIYVHPLTQKIVEDEAKRLDRKFTQKGIQNIRIEAIREVCELSDKLLCPSQFVAEGVIALDPKYESKITICAYGSSINYEGSKAKPVKGRVFWAGGDAIRKGLFTLAEAANELLGQYPDMEFRIAGVPKEEGELFNNFVFLGKLNYEEMKKEFLSADIFVFPTLSEGMAGTVIEALAAGCPVITTKAAGIDGLISGKQGFLVKERSSNELCEAIQTIYHDRNLQRNMSEEAKILARAYTLDNWGKRLLGVIKEVVDE